MQPPIKSKEVSKMTYEKKSKKFLVIATALTIVALVSVGVTFAAISATFHGQAVTVNDIAQGTVKYSTDESSWSSTMPVLNVGSGHWYAEFVVSSTTYTGSATVTFQLEKSTDGGNTFTSTGTPLVITGFALNSTSTIYGTNDGSSGGTYHDFIGDILVGGTYRITVTVASG